MFTKKFLQKLETSEKILFFTGAGISAESGIPTFRGKDGIWTKLKPEELASFDAFLKNTDLVWEWYQQRRQIVNESKPNAAHLAIAEFEKYYNEVSVVTQNIDNLHGRAKSSHIYELHGNIERNYCIKCHKWFNDIEVNDSNKKEAPKCDVCGGLIRPDIVWFGEMLPQETFSTGEQKAAESDICFIVGTSAVVYPAAYIPITARQSGSYLVEINIERTEITGFVDDSFFGEAGKILPQILDEVKKLRPIKQLG